MQVRHGWLRNGDLFEMRGMIPKWSVYKTDLKIFIQSYIVQKMN
jgi:urease accessory protein UreH